MLKRELTAEPDTVTSSPAIAPPSSSAANRNAVPRTTKLTRGIRYTRLAIHIVWGLAIAGLVFPRITRAQRARITQRWSAGLLRVLNIALTVHGAELPDATKRVIAANHVSWLDIFVINAAHPALFVAKSEIRDWPVAGWLCEKAGTIFVRRTKRTDAARTNDEIHDALAQGDAIGLFPEGTTTAGDRLHKFHTSLFESAVANRASVSPAAIRYLLPGGERCTEAAYHGDIGFSDSIRQIVSNRTIIAEITFAPAIDAADKSRRDLATEAETAVAVILDVPLPSHHQRFDPAAAQEHAHKAGAADAAEDNSG
jgi:1-acyl-sn-glycerol-3-phosphate acyltransferase